FGAPFGLVPPDGAAARCLVAIRNVQWTREGSVIHAGCGVVGPSRLEREWNELGSKLDAIQQALGL
ncbi:MAG TPA: chorismate-binding protein, partial [Fimbriimonadaceae bacterium]|nr:chorismate-binding protein [Fimbriimonadaceae bacterium]